MGLHVDNAAAWIAPRVHPDRMDGLEALDDVLSDPRVDVIDARVVCRVCGAEIDPVAAVGVIGGWTLAHRLGHQVGAC